MPANTLRRRLAALAITGSWAICGGALAAAPDWRVEVSRDRCIASQETDAGLFELNSLAGEVGFAIFAPTGVRLPMGEQGVLEIDARRVMFTPSYVDDGAALYFDGTLSGGDVKALRAARDLRITVDGQLVAAFTPGDDLPKALDGLVACSNGARGAWGAGVRRQP